MTKYIPDFERLNRRNIWNRNEKRKVLVAKYAELRKALKEKGDWAALSLLPRNSSPVRLRRLCTRTGRARGIMSAPFPLCRFQFRMAALNGELPGVKKVSW